MSYGLEVRNSSNQLRLTITDRLTRVIWSQVVGKDASGSATVDMNGARNPKVVSLLCDSTVGLKDFRAPHNVALNGNTVSWTPNSITSVRAASLIMVMAYE